MATTVSRLKATLKKKQKKYDMLIKKKRILFAKVEKVDDMSEMVASEIEEIEYKLHGLKRKVK